MSQPIDDFWPSEVNYDEVILPSAILEVQARQLGERTKGMLKGRLDKVELADRITTNFMVDATVLKREIKLFYIQHQVEFGYPVSISAPESNLPDYLKEKRYVSGPMAHLTSIAIEGKWVKNDWVATSPEEFSEKLKALLSTSRLKSIVLSLVAESHKSLEDSNDVAEPE